jgi:hypothetical protein
VTQIESDGHVAIRNTQSRINAGLSWQQINNICKRQPPPETALAEMPSGDVLAALKPHLVNSSSSVNGEKAWLLNFQPDGRFIEQLLMLPLLSKATTNSERQWVISTSELQEIEQGHFTVKVAQIWVTQNSPRTIFQIFVSIRLESGVYWAFKATVRPQNGGSAKLDLSIPARSC